MWDSTIQDGVIFLLKNLNTSAPVKPAAIKGNATFVASHL